MFSFNPVTVYGISVKQSQWVSCCYRNNKVIYSCTAAKGNDSAASDQSLWHKDNVWCGLWWTCCTRDASWITYALINSLVFCRAGSCGLCLFICCCFDWVSCDATLPYWPRRRGGFTGVPLTLAITRCIFQLVTNFYEFFVDLVSFVRIQFILNIQYLSVSQCPIT